MNLTDLFINGLVAQSQAIPLQVIEQAKKCLLDYVGVAIGGSAFLKEKHPSIFESFTRESGNITVFGMSRKTTATNATLLNGFSAHALELDDGHRHGMIHLGASIITAILAASEKRSLQYSCILKGIVMGYEVAVRCAKAIQPGHKLRGYHVSGTCGTIGSGMGIAFACGFNDAQLKATLACTISSAAGILEIQEDASEMKPYNVGRAAMDGLIASEMGSLAFLGPDDMLGGKRGFLAVMSDTPHIEPLTDFTNNDYAIEGIYQKVHAACRHCHPAIDAALELRGNLRFSIDQVDRIVVHTYKLAVGSHDHTLIRGISSAKLSTPFSVALAIVRGHDGYADFNDASLDDYWVKNLTRKISVIEDEFLTAQSPAVRGARVTLYLKDGNTFESACLYPKGEPEHPLSREELEEKFRGLAKFGGMNEVELEEVIDSVWNDKFSVDQIHYK